MPEQYWRLSPLELTEMMRGEYEREQMRWRRAAWVTSHILNVSGKSLKKAVTADQLLGEGKARPKNVDADVDELLRRAKALEARQGD